MDGGFDNVALFSTSEEKFFFCSLLAVLALAGLAGWSTPGNVVMAPSAIKASADICQLLLDRHGIKKQASR